MTRKARILVVEDEAAIRNGLVDVLIFHGYEVDTAAEGPVGLEKALSGKFDLVLLDVMLPGLDGFTLCNRIREQDREQAIIMLTAKTSDEDIIHGLSLGADDYVGKPFSVAQLVEIDTRNLAGRCQDKPLSFTRREMDILQYLHNNHARPVPREELLSKIWGYAKNLDLETRTVDIHIAKLRRKLEPEPAQPRYLVTVRGAGYRLLVE
jgi:DNA-binding response OmpR family regulator